MSTEGEELNTECYTSNMPTRKYKGTCWTLDVCTHTTHAIIVNKERRENTNGLGE